MGQGANGNNIHPGVRQQREIVTGNTSGHLDNRLPANKFDGDFYLREIHVVEHHDLYASVQSVEGVEYIKEMQMSWLDSRNRPHVETKKIELLDHEVIVSDKHKIKASE